MPIGPSLTKFLDISLVADSFLDQAVNVYVDPSSALTFIKFESQIMTSHGGMNDFELSNNNEWIKILYEGTYSAALSLFIDHVGINPETLFVVPETSFDNGDTWVRNPEGRKVVIDTANEVGALASGRFVIQKNQMFRIGIVGTGNLTLRRDIVSVNNIQFPSASLTIQKEADSTGLIP